MDPINYSIDVKSPFESAVSGYQTGLAMEDAQLKQTQQQVALAQQLQMQRDLANLAANKNATAQDYASVMVRYPQLAEHLQKGFNTLNSEQQQNELNFGTQVYAALRGGKSDIAEQLIDGRLTAYKNSGQDRQAAHMEALKRLIKLDPNATRSSTGMMLFSAMGPEKFGTVISSLGNDVRAEELQPSAVEKSEAEARLKTAEADNAPIDIKLKNRKAAEDIESTQLKREIDKLDIQIKQANSETQRGELQVKRDELNQKLLEKTQTQQTDSQNQLDTVGTAIENAKSLASHPLLKSSIGVGSAFGKLLGFIPGTENKDFRAQVDTLKSQLFLPAVAALKSAGAGGALSDAEGKKLDSQVASLDADQSPEAFKNNLNIVIKSLERAQAKIVASGKLPTDKGAFVMNHPVYGQVNDGIVNKLLTQFPGATREQVIQYLRSTGGK